MRKIMVCLLAPILLLPLSGCWNYSELNERTIIAGAAIDLTESGEVMLTAEAAEFHAQDAPSAKSALLTGRGESLGAAIYDITNQSGRELYWDQAALLIVSSRYADRGIRELLDYILDEHSLRLTLLLAVSRLETAAEVYTRKIHGDDIRSYAMTDIIQEESRLGKTVQADAREIIDRYLEPGVEFALPQILSDAGRGKETVDVTGCGVFREDKLVGWLDRDATECLQILSGKAERVEIDLLVETTHITVETRNWKTKMKPAVQDGRVVTAMELRADYEVLMTDGSVDAQTPEGTAKVNAALSRYMEGNVACMWDSLRMAASDVTGVGKRLWQREPARFRALGDWAPVFCRSEAAVYSHFRNATVLSDGRALLYEK